MNAVCQRVENEPTKLLKHFPLDIGLSYWMYQKNLGTI